MISLSPSTRNSIVALPSSFCVTACVSCHRTDDAWINAQIGLGWCWQYAVVDQNSKVSMDFASKGLDDEVIRVELKPGKGTVVDIVNNEETIVAIRFANDFSISPS